MTGDSFTPWSELVDVDTLIDALQLGVVVHEPDTTIAAANPQALDLLRMTHNQAVGVDALDPRWHLIDEAGRRLPHDQYPVNLALSSGWPVLNQTLGINADDQTSWVKCNAYRRAVDGRVIVTFVDVTAETEAQKALAIALREEQASRDKLRATASRLEVSLAAVSAHTFVHDIDADMIFFDDDFAPLLGLESETTALSLSQLQALTHPDDLKSRATEYAKLLEAEDSRYHHIARLKHRDGHWVWVETQGRRFQQGDSAKPTHAIGVLFDISERKAMEATLLQTQKMEALGTLAGGIAHDFNNLLVPIMGYAALAKRSLPEDSAGAQYLGHVERAAERARDLVQKILLISRTSSLDKERASVVTLVNEVLVVLNASVPAGITVETHVDDDIPYITADAAKIYQVLLNLCTNAVQAMGEQGQLVISIRQAERAPSIAPGKHHAEGYVVVSVTDDGCGMSPDIVKRIFDPFFTTKNKGERRGTGLGLSIVSGVIEEHEGTVTVDSQLGAGTTATVYLPADSGVGAATVAPRESPPVDSLNILLIDDEEPVRSLTTSLLEQLGHTVTAFAKGSEASAALLAQPEFYQLVLTDYEMPDMTGDELLKHIKSVRQDIPVILLTGYSNLTTKDQQQRLGFDGALAKPFELGSMANTIAETLSGMVQKAIV